MKRIWQAVVVLGVAGLAWSADTAPKKLPGSDIIPAERLADWRPGVTVGVPGGIPTDRNNLIDVTKDPYKADNTGATDAAAAIQKAVDDAKAKDVVYLPEGKYRLDKGIRISYKSNFTVRGAGMGKTILLMYPGTGPYPAFDIGSCASGADWDYGDRQKISIGGSPKRGATELSIGDTKVLDAYPNGGIGMPVQLSLKNDNKLPVMAPAHWEYLRKQMVRITAKTATTVTISPGLLFDLPDSLAPLMRPCGRWVEFTGIEDLTIDGDNTKAPIGIRIDAAYACWLKNVAVLNITNYHVALGAIQCEIRGCWMAKRKGAGSNGAGILFGGSNCLIEDNVLIEQFPHMEVNGAGGNVLAYNACYDSSIFQGDFGLLGCSIDTNHGAQSSFNLYEGNVAQRFQSDGYHGSSSQDTAFRNWFHATSDKTQLFWICVDLNRFTRNYNIVGNVLGHKDYTWSYDNADNGFGYETHFIYVLGMPNMGNGGFNGQTAQPSKGKNWADWDKMLAAPPGGGPGPNGFQELDLDVKATTLLLGNYNYCDKGVRESESLKGKQLPASLYLTGKPKWFGDLAWPPFGPDTDFEKNKIPAQVRYEAMTKKGN